MKRKLITSVSIGLAAVILIFALVPEPVQADYKLADGTKVQWLGGNKLKVTRPDGTSYQTIGTKQGNRLVPPEIIASKLPSGQGKLEVISTTGKKETINVTYGYAVGNTNYYWTGQDDKLATVNTATKTASIVDSYRPGKSQTGVGGDRVVPVTYATDPNVRAAINQAINNTGGWFNYTDRLKTSLPTMTTTTTTTEGTVRLLPETIGGAKIIGHRRQVDVYMPDGSVKTVFATDYQGAWAGKGAYVLEGKTMDEAVKNALLKQGMPYDAKNDIFIMQFARGTNVGTVGWEPVKGQVLTGNSAVDSVIWQFLSARGYDSKSPVVEDLVGVLDSRAPVMKNLNALLDKLRNQLESDAGWQQGLIARGFVIVNSILNWEGWKKEFMEQLLNYATSSGRAWLILPPDKPNISTDETKEVALPQPTATPTPTPQNPQPSNPVPLISGDLAAVSASVDTSGNIVAKFVSTFSINGWANIRFYRQNSSGITQIGSTLNVHIQANTSIIESIKDPTITENDTIWATIDLIYNGSWNGEQFTGTDNNFYSEPTYENNKVSCRMSTDGGNTVRTSDLVHGKITVTQTPNFVFTKWHRDQNGNPASMTITIKWEDIRIGSIFETPTGLSEVTAPAYVTNVVAFHNIHRYTNKPIESNNWVTEHPVESNVDLANQQATFKFQYRKAGREDSTVYFKLYLNGSDKYILIYCNVPVNGYNPSLFREAKTNKPLNIGFKTANVRYKTRNKNEETIEF